MLSSANNEVLTIGIFGSNGKTSTASILSSIFNNAGVLTKIICDKKDVAHKRNMANIEAYKKLKSTGNNDIIIIEITEDLLRNGKLSDIDFNILIHSYISEGSYEGSAEGINSINAIINSPPGARVVVLNTDDKNWKKIVIDVENTYIYTYGLGNKATVTASSIEYNNEIKFCYCLQRAITSFNGNLIEPMEVPFVIKGHGQYNVYNGIAAITSAILCGINLSNIISPLNNNTLQGGLKVLYDNGFNIIDNVCDTILGFETGFEAVQNMSYEKICLAFNLDAGNSEYVNSKIIEVIGTWSLILNMSNVFFLDNNEYDLSSYYFQKLKSNLAPHGIGIIKKRGTISDIEGIVDSLGEKDILLFFCSSHFDVLRNEIIEMLDRRILRSF